MDFVLSAVLYTWAAFALILHTVNCQCPTSWGGEYWRGYDTTLNSDVHVIFSSTASSSFTHVNANTRATIATYTCDGSSDPDALGFTYTVRRLSTDAVCYRAVSAVHNNLLVVGTATLASPTAAACAALNASLYQTNVYVRKVNADSATKDCNFGGITGSYLAKYARTECTGFTTSTAVITDSTMTINTCYTGTVNYANPLRDTTLTCVNAVEPPELVLQGRTEDPNKDGAIIILSSTTVVPGRTVYYCARSQGVTANFEVYVALDSSNGNALSCSPDVFPSTVRTGVTSLLLTANDCASLPCLNGGTCVQELGSFTCICPPGYTGALCETEINECESDPCIGPNTCVDLLNAFRCDCSLGWNGTLCETYNPCVGEAPCLNGGTCTSPSNGTFTCACAATFTGQRCETELFCTPNPCLNGGTCAEGTGAAVCTCVAGFTGSVCQTNIDECVSSPCVGTGSTCNDLVNGYTCNCPTGRTGTNCQIYNPCLAETPSPCLNGGTCSNPSNGTFSCACATGYTGTNCETELQCVTNNPCQNGATCIEGDPPTCVCPTGYQGATCSEIDCRAAGFECLNGGDCDPNTGTCTCPVGTTGQRCETSTLNCVTNNVCQNNGTCIQLANGSAICQCPDGYAGIFCQDKFDCNEYPCKNNGTCDAATGQCQCPPGFSGSACETETYDCSKEGCRNGGVCNTTTGLCQCPLGFSGAGCDIFSCVPGSCLNNGTCNEFTKQCNCPEGYTGVRCETKLDQGGGGGLNLAFIISMAVIGGALVIALLFCLLCYCMSADRRPVKRRRTNSKERLAPTFAIAYAPSMVSQPSYMAQPSIFMHGSYVPVMDKPRSMISFPPPSVGMFGGPRSVYNDDTDDEPVVVSNFNPGGVAMPPPRIKVRNRPLYRNGSVRSNTVRIVELPPESGSSSVAKVPPILYRGDSIRRSRRSGNSVRYLDDPGRRSIRGSVRSIRSLKPGQIDADYYPDVDIY